MSWFRFTIGLAHVQPLLRWWERWPEVKTGVYTNQRPRAIHRGDTLIYYMAGGGGRIVAAAEVTGAPGNRFDLPPSWKEHGIEPFEWRIPVRLLAWCPPDDRAPLFEKLARKRAARGPYQRLDADVGRAMHEAIDRCAEGAAGRE